MNDDTSDRPDFHDGELRAQTRWGDPAIWDAAHKTRLLWKAIPEPFHPRIEAVPFFFLATSDGRGNCDCSFKGGGPGLIRMLAPDRLAFPDFGGNGAFMSLGNILENPRVGLLLIDFADGTRLRVNGAARIVEGDAASELFADCRRAVVVHIEQVVPNCTKHVPRLMPVED